MEEETSVVAAPSSSSPPRPQAASAASPFRKYADALSCNNCHHHATNYCNNTNINCNTQSNNNNNDAVSNNNNSGSNTTTTKRSILIKELIPSPYLQFNKSTERNVTSAYPIFKLVIVPLGVSTTTSILFSNNTDNMDAHMYFMRNVCHVGYLFVMVVQFVVGRIWIMLV